MKNKERWEEKHRNSRGRYNRVTQFARFCFFNYLKDTKGRLLDLGSGKGGDAIYFHYKGFNVTAVDFSHEAIKQFNETQKLKKVFITAIVKDYSEGLAFDNNFDIVYSRLGLNYFDTETTKKLFSDVKSILKSEGYFMFQVKSDKDKSCGEGKEIEPGLYEDEEGYYRRYFSKDFVKELLNDFEIICLKETILDNGHAYLDVVAKKS